MKRIQKPLILASLALTYLSITALPAKAINDTLKCGALGDIGPTHIDLCAQTTFAGVITIIIGYLLSLVGIVLAIVILISAIQYITAAGSPERIKSAKDRLVQAAVSLGFLIAFNSIFSLLQNNVFKDVSGNSLADVATLGNNVTTILLVAVGALAVIFIIIGGIQYSLSAGDPNKVSQAKSTITYAIIGLAMSMSVGIVIAVLNQLAN